MTTAVRFLDASGEPVVDTVNPIPKGSRMMLSEEAQAKFGQLPGAALKCYEAACRNWLQQIMAVSALPAHMVGITTENPSSSEAIRASESALTARAEQRQAVFGRSWEQVARLMVAIRDGVDPSTVDVSALWRDPGSTSKSAEADSVTKLVAAGITSRAEALRRLGCADARIATVTTNGASRVRHAEGLWFTRICNRMRWSSRIVLVSRVTPVGPPMPVR